MMINKFKSIRILKSNFYIYTIGIIISIILILLYFIKPLDNAFCVLMGSIGSGSLSAIILAWFLECSNIRNLENKKINDKNIMIAPISKELINIICYEISTIEKKDKSFHLKVQEKTLVEIIGILSEYYDEILMTNDLETKIGCETFNSTHELELQKRLSTLNFVGGLLDYSIDDICFNRSFNIYNDLFTDAEMKNIKILQTNFKKLKNSENFVAYIYNFLDFISWIDCFNPEKSLFKTLNSIKKYNNNYIDEKEKRVYAFNFDY